MYNEIEIPFSLHFDRVSKPTIQEVVDSLQGFEAIACRFPKIISSLINVPVFGISTNVNSIKIGSLYDDLIVKFMFGGQEQMDLFLEEMHRKFMNHKSVPYLVFFLLLVVGGISAYQIFSPSSAPVSHIIASNNTTIINMISADVGKNPDIVRNIVNSAIPKYDSIKLAKDSYKIFNAFGDSDSLKITQSSNYSLPSEFVRELPSNLDFDSVDDLKEFDNVEVQIRAADMDSIKTGWAAKIPSVIDRRVKLKVFGDIDVSKIQIGQNIKADITAVYKISNGVAKISYCVLRKVY